eukprot:scaffold104210_cov75-Phaeocystis_antarctica.AAC.5
MKKACVHSSDSIAAVVVASPPEWASTAPLGRLQTLYTAGYFFSSRRSIPWWSWSRSPVQPPLTAASVKKISVMYDGPSNSHRASAGTASSLTERVSLVAAMAGHACSTDGAVQRNWLTRAGAAPEWSILASREPTPSSWSWSTAGPVIELRSPL